MIGAKTKILLLLLLYHSILVTCHTIILDNRKPHERKSCSKVICSKYLSPSFDDDHHWPSSFFKRRKDSSGDKTSSLESDDIDSTAESVAKFSTTDIQDIESLKSEMESLERRTGSRNDAAYYSEGSDAVRKFEMKKRRKRRGIYNDDQGEDEGREIIDVTRSGNTTGFNGRRKRGDESRYLIDDSTSFPSASMSSSPVYSSSSSFSWKEERRTKRETTGKWVRKKRGARDKIEESKQRAERRRMKCCQQWKKEEQERTGESENIKRHEEGESTFSPNPLEFHHRFGSSPPFQASTAMQVHHTSFPPYLLPPSSSHFHSPHPSIPPHPLLPLPHPILPPPHPFLPNTASFGSEQPNALHFSLLGPSIPSLRREMFNNFNLLPSTPSLSMGFNQNADGQMFRLPFPLMSPNPLPVPTPNQSESKSDSEEEKSQPNEGRTGESTYDQNSESTFVDEEEEERRRIDHELERKRQIMIMSGQYQPYEPWIHGPILPVF